MTVKDIIDLSKRKQKKQLLKIKEIAENIFELKEFGYYVFTVGVNKEYEYLIIEFLNEKTFSEIRVYIWDDHAIDNELARFETISVDTLKDGIITGCENLHSKYDLNEALNVAKDYLLWELKRCSN